MPRTILKLEGMVVFIAILLYWYHINPQSWIFFALLLFVPDVSMIGYLLNKRIGSITYNLGHNYILATGLIFLGVFSNNTILALGLILTAHVSVDRFLGFGLKYPSGFKHTHMQKV